MGRSDGILRIEDIELGQVQEFYEWLQQKRKIEGFDFRSEPNLTDLQAFSVIYYLQEELGVLPDKYERCEKCGRIFDSYEEGAYINGETTIVTDNNEEIEANFPEEMYGCYCEDCRPD